MISKCFFRERVELSRFNVGLELAVPKSAIELDEPAAKFRQLVRRKLRDLLLETFNFTHMRPNDCTRVYARDR